jgi:hypothetical protein
MTNIPNELERKAVVDAVLNLFGASKTESLMLPIPGTNPQLWIAAGELDEIRSLAAMTNDNKQPDAVEWKPTHAEVVAWNERNGGWFQGRIDEARCAIDDARSIHMLSAAPTPPSAPVQQSVREAFEEYFKATSGLLDADHYLLRDANDKYADSFTASAWEWWQAALSTSWMPLSDVQWMNIVNYDQSWIGYNKDDAIHEAVKMTEARCRENNSNLSTSPLLDKNDQAEGEEVRAWIYKDRIGGSPHVTFDENEADTLIKLGQDIVVPVVTVSYLKECLSALEFYASKFRYGSTWDDTQSHVMNDKGKIARDTLAARPQPPVQEVMHSASKDAPDSNELVVAMKKHENLLVGAAYAAAAKVVDGWAKTASEYGFDGDMEQFMRVKADIEALTPAAAMDEIEQFGMRIVRASTDWNKAYILSDEQVRAIVANVRTRAK